jgi:hypothetical protein
VAAQVDRDGLPAALGDRGGGLAPGAEGLPATVQEHHRPRRRVAEAIGDDTDAAGPLDRERFRCLAHQVIVRPGAQR